jgi:hypothetical protein
MKKGKPYNGMHPIRNIMALIIKGSSGRVMPGVRPQKLRKHTLVRSGAAESHQLKRYDCLP